MWHFERWEVPLGQVRKILRLIRMLCQAKSLRVSYHIYKPMPYLRAARHFFDELTLGQTAIEFHIAANCAF